MRDHLAPMTPDRVHEVIGRHLIGDGFSFVLDMEESRGCRIVDRRTGRSFVDFFGFYASNTLGMHHPGLTDDEAFRRRLLEAATHKVTNTEVYTEHMARFVETFSRVGIPEYLPHAFFISGGALAVENALKAAFDWKVQKNFEKGYREERGHQVLHLDRAFHGRTGYTLSLTHSHDDRKTRHFPKFDWPRIANPVANGRLSEEQLVEVRRSEEQALSQARRYFEEREDRIAAIILEPLQGEGGDNHFRPEFLRSLRGLADRHEALLIFDEVQTGVAASGRMWAHQALGVRPDILAFGKKSQVCGILASERLDEVPENVFTVSSRINSTWGGNLVDMVRFDRILEVIEEENLAGRAEEVGQYLGEQLWELEEQFEAVTAARGLGLLCAFDLPGKDLRDRVVEAAYEEGLLVLGSGPRTVRFRPPLTIERETIDEGIGILRGVLESELGG